MYTSKTGLYLYRLNIKQIKSPNINYMHKKTSGENYNNDEREREREID